MSPEPAVSLEAQSVEHSHPAPSEHTQPTSAMGLYLRDIRKTSLLTADEEKELGRRVQRGDQEARSRMIESNLRLVVMIAKRYVNRGLSFTDLVEEGNVGLVKAVDRFKPSKGCRFSTYGTWWIRQAIERALINQVRTVRVPVHVSDDLSRLNRVEREMHRAFRRAPSDEELEDETGFTLVYIRRLRSLQRRTMSIDQPLDSDGEFTLKDKLEDPHVSDPSEAIHAEKLRHLIRSKLGILDAREQKILTLRFGLRTGEFMTLEKIGRIIGVTRERIRQIQVEALAKLRAAIEEDGIEFSELS